VPRFLLIVVTLLAASLYGVGGASAQSYPQRTVRLILLASIAKVLGLKAATQ
jgi:hypothetical protein